MDKEKLIKGEFDSLPDGWIVLLETSIEKLNDLTLESIKTLVDKGYSGIIVSTNRPVNNLLSLYKSTGIDTEKIFVLDCVTRQHSVNIQEMKNVIFTENVSDLTHISISFNDLMDASDGSRFFFIDSLNTMLVYNDANALSRFIHSTLTKARMRGLSGLLISLEKEGNPEIRAEIAQLCDKVIRI